MKRISLMGLASAALFLGGCWTFNKTEYPAVAVTAPAGDMAKKTIAVNGFETSFTQYAAVYGYSMSYVPGYYGRRHYHPGYFMPTTTTTYVPQAHVTDMFQRRAREQIEDAGYAVAAGVGVPDYTVEVHFGGPFKTTGECCATLAWEVFSLFLLDYDTVQWTAKLRIRDNKTGRIAFTHDYVQRFETKVVGLVPIFSIASCEETDDDSMQMWCLSALTDRAVADATAFLSAQ